jgi:hypothetical protein
MSLDVLMFVQPQQLDPTPLTLPVRFAGMAWHEVVFGGTARDGIMLGGANSDFERGRVDAQARTRRSVI